MRLMRSDTGATMVSWALGRIWQSVFTEKSNGTVPTIRIAAKTIAAIVMMKLRLLEAGFRQMERMAWNCFMRGTDSTSMALVTAPVQRRAISARLPVLAWALSVVWYSARMTPSTGDAG